MFTQQPDRLRHIFSVHRTIWLRQACQTFSGLCEQKSGVDVTKHTGLCTPATLYTLRTWFKMEDADLIELVRARPALFDKKDRNYTEILYRGCGSRFPHN
ncbi:hypothetical protein PoB_000925900 [Plakobranchus ocellatus]|uniref:Uncharacterized protein n=1 Tax=Plakobranchus ocellatus TaxID=259542 RepID=A0AAV3YIC9_9GAST|nr:hypothetical protein PoB_000925900 [Plakobranchus ocellatus]